MSLNQETKSEIEFMFRGNRNLDIYTDLVGIVLRGGIEHNAMLSRALAGNKNGAQQEAKNRIRPYVDRFGQFVIKEDDHVKTITGLDIGCMYYTDDKTSPMVFEHVCPITAVSDAYLDGQVELRNVLFNPVCLVGKDTSKTYLIKEHVIGGYDPERPFIRYAESGLHNSTKIWTWTGVEVNTLRWTWEDHVKQVIQPHKIWNHLYHTVLR